MLDAVQLKNKTVLVLFHVRVVIIKIVSIKLIKNGASNRYQAKGTNYIGIEIVQSVKRLMNIDHSWLSYLIFNHSQAYYKTIIYFYL